MGVIFLLFISVIVSSVWLVVAAAYGMWILVIILLMMALLNIRLIFKRTVTAYRMLKIIDGHDSNHHQ